MANYQSLKTAINAVIKANGNKEITGTVLNEVLLAMVNSLGAGYQFAGVATPDTNPGTPDQKVFYIASQAGTYTNFNGAVVSDGIAIFEWSGTWTTEILDLSMAGQVQSDWTETDTTKKSYIKHKPNIPPSANVDPVPTNGSPNAVASGGVYNALKTITDFLTNGYYFVGIAGTSTVPDSVTQYGIFYIASDGGTYTNFLNGDDEPLTLYQGLNILYKDIEDDGWNYFEVFKFSDFVDTTQQQSLSAQQKAQARTNIAAVSYDAQSLNADQQVQAQNNMMSKDYSATASDHSGLGKVYLDKNNGVLTQSMVNTANTVYVIQYDYTISGTVTIPTNCTLEFDGGSIKYGVINTNHCYVSGNYLSSIGCLQGEYIVQSITSCANTVDLSNSIIVKTSDELESVLTSGNSYNFIYLMGDVFLIRNAITVTAGGTILPYPGYTPTIFGSRDVVTNKSITNNKCEFNLGYTPASRFFYLFDDNGNNLEINTLSSTLGVQAVYANGNVTYSGNKITIPMTSEVKSLIANKNAAFFSNATLTLKTWFISLVLTDVYTDADNIYGNSTVSDYTQYCNWDNSKYGLPVRYEIFNLPVGTKNAYIDKDNVCHVDHLINGLLVCDKSNLMTFNDGKQVLFSDIAFKGGAGNFISYEAGAGDKSFLGCTFEYIYSVFYALRYSKIDKCRFTNIGYNAIYCFAETKIENCDFFNVGLLTNDSKCIYAIGAGILVNNNTFRNFSYIGIFTGHREDASNECTVSNNLLDNSGFANLTEKYCLIDGGAIYSERKNVSLLIENNTICNYKTRVAGAVSFGIHLDDGAYNVTVRKNVIYGISGYCIISYYSMEGDTGLNNTNNTIENNIFCGYVYLDGRDANNKITINNNILSIIHPFVTNGYITTSGNQFIPMSVEGNYIKVCSSYLTNELKIKNVLVDKTYFKSVTMPKHVEFPSAGRYALRLKFPKMIQSDTDTAFNLMLTFNNGASNSLVNIPLLFHTDSSRTTISNRALPYIESTNYIISSVNSDRNVNDAYQVIDVIVEIESYCYCDISVEFESFSDYWERSCMCLACDCSVIATTDSSYQALTEQINFSRIRSVRPDNPSLGFSMIDSALSPQRMIYYIGNNTWIDSAGTSV